MLGLKVFSPHVIIGPQTVKLLAHIEGGNDAQVAQHLEQCEEIVCEFTTAPINQINHLHYVQYLGHIDSKLRGPHDATRSPQLQVSVDRAKNHARCVKNVGILQKMKIARSFMAIYRPRVYGLHGALKRWGWPQHTSL